MAVRIPNNPNMTAVVVSSNLTTTPGIVTKTLLGMTVADNWLSTDPQLVNTTGPYDFRLSASGPAVDRGLTVSCVINDYEGVLRPQGLAFDIGAYETFWAVSGTSLNSLK